MTTHGSRCRAAAGVVLAILLFAGGAAAGSASLVNSCAVRIRPATAPTSQIYISLHEVELYNAAGAKIPTSSISASSASVWPGAVVPYVADFCNDGILTSEPGPGIDTWTNLCHTAQGDKYPTMTFTYPCQQGLSKAVVYNFRDPSGALYPTGSLLNQFVLDVLVNENSIAYTKPLQAVLVQEVAYMDPSVEANSCSVRLRPTTASPEHMMFREVVLFDARGVQIPASLVTGSMSSAYTGQGQDFSASKCLDGATWNRNWNSFNLCFTLGPLTGDPYPWMRFGYPCAGGLSKVVLYNRLDWGTSYASVLSLDVTNLGKTAYTFAFNTTQEVYNIPVIMSANQPAAWQCSKPKAKDLQALSSGNKTAEQVCIANGRSFFFTDGVNTEYPGCGNCDCCKVAGAVEDNPCRDIHRGCEKCGKIRIPGTTKTTTACTACFLGWRLRRDGESKICDCAPGMAFNGTRDDISNWCAPCPKGQYCPGGGADNPESAASSCPEGLATVSTGAKSSTQCFTAPGFGRTTTQVGIQTVVQVTECPIGTYNTGGNTAGCQKCGAGLTTLGPRSMNASMCLAPAGSYVERGTGKACQKGMYSEELNNLSACIACPAGVTTPGDGSNSSSACGLARPGFHLVNTTAAAASAAAAASKAATAAVCPPGSYQGREAAVFECSPCDFGYYTRAEGAAGNAECLAPPGWELKPGASLITECELGYFKEGWNKNNCSACGSGLTTAKIGSVSADACLIPAGWGLSQLTPEAIAVKWSYNEGLNRKPCRACDTGYTSLAAGADGEDSCVVQSGWAMDSKFNIPKPCDAGTWGAGGTIEDRNGSCIACPRGFTTQRDESDSAADCNACAAGYGVTMVVYHLSVYC
ncbi:hypothetical protein OEZ85_006646 [Tetradesmus obliquus]|uniref:Tyrosine-protein kinase ephrin type A/B receptor-like domain-containing protein n=1 Tax=Tetradesmus obliquus TaxID=3088 RepID=A0ABY8U030_TETOB|nr:hypothetical protein OEZ85_006646 [Tetradesmus obliquus]